MKKIKDMESDIKQIHKKEETVEVVQEVNTIEANNSEPIKNNFFVVKDNVSKEVFKEKETTVVVKQEKQTVQNPPIIPEYSEPASSKKPLPEKVPSTKDIPAQVKDTKIKLGDLSPGSIKNEIIYIKDTIKEIVASPEPNKNINIASINQSIVKEDSTQKVQSPTVEKEKKNNPPPANRGLVSRNSFVSKISSIYRYTDCIYTTYETVITRIFYQAKKKKDVGFTELNKLVSYNYELFNLKFVPKIDDRGE